MLRVAIAVLMVVLVGAAPAAADSTTSTPSASRPATSPTATSPTATAPTSPAAAAPPSTATSPTTVPAELPADEAALQNLLSDVRSRLTSLQVRIAQANSDIASDQAQLDVTTHDLLAAEIDAATAAANLAVLRIAEAQALAEVRRLAVAAYVNQPVAQLVTMLLHVSGPNDLLDAEGFYRSIVDAQHHAIDTYNTLVRAATDADQRAAKDRELASRKQQALTQNQVHLESLRQTLVGVQQASAAQEAQQTQLLTQAGQDRAQFEAELAAQAAESASITRLLASLDSASAAPPPSPTGGFFELPVPGAPITQRFGPNNDPFTGAPGFHPGVDFGAPTGTPIRAAGDGVVVYAGEESGYGNYTCINHGGGVATCYGHQSALFVAVGDHVTRGQVIGLVGSTGYSTGPHLHFEVRINGTPVDPLPWLT